MTEASPAATAKASQVSSAVRRMERRTIPRKIFRPLEKKNAGRQQLGGGKVGKVGKVADPPRTTAREGVAQ
jgi:hypothetical protein